MYLFAMYVLKSSIAYSLCCCCCFFFTFRNHDVLISLIYRRLWISFCSSSSSTLLQINNQREMICRPAQWSVSIHRWCRRQDPQRWRLASTSAVVHRRLQTRSEDCVILRPRQHSTAHCHRTSRYDRKLFNWISLGVYLFFLLSRSHNASGAT